MRRLTIPRKPRWVLIWFCAFTLLLGFRYEMEYRNRLNHLPTLVDADGTTASLETAMAGLDAYAEAKKIRRHGFISLGTGAVLFVAAAATKSRVDGLNRS